MSLREAIAGEVKRLMEGSPEMLEIRLFKQQLRDFQQSLTVLAQQALAEQLKTCIRRQAEQELLGLFRFDKAFRDDLRRELRSSDVVRQAAEDALQTGAWADKLADLVEKVISERLSLAETEAAAKHENEKKR